MKIFLKLVLPLCLVLNFIVYANPTPPSPTSPNEQDPECAICPPKLPIDDYVFPMLFVSLGLAYYIIQFRTKKTPS